MNKVYTLSNWFLFFFLLQMPNVYSQDILSEDNQWYILDNYHISTKIFRFNGDTTINDLVYKELFTEDDENQGLLYSQNLFFREDSNKVYILDSLLEEQLIYDFSLNAGDTLYYSDCFITVLSVDSTTLLNNEKRKRLNIQINYPDSTSKLDSWIEGIGSISGLLYTYKHCNKAFWSRLDCFFINEEKVYKNPANEGDNCWFLWLLSAEEIPKLPIYSIYPNPGTTEWRIESDKFIKNIVLQIFDFSGTMVMQGLVSGNPYTINIENFSKGIYYIQIISKDQIYIKKAIKI